MADFSAVAIGTGPSIPRAARRFCPAELRQRRVVGGRRDEEIGQPGILPLAEGQKVRAAHQAFHQAART